MSKAPMKMPTLMKVASERSDEHTRPPELVIGLSYQNE